MSRWVDTRVCAVRALLLALVVIGNALPAVAQSLPSGWATADIGSVGAAGSSSASGSILSVAGAGADIWDTSDAFRFTYRAMTGDGSIVAQVSTLQNLDAWTKAGVMMRDALIPTSRHASMFVSPGKGVAFQRRKQPGGISYHTSGAASGAPYFVRVTRKGETFEGFASRDGVSWTSLGTTTIAMGKTIYVGLAVTSHIKGRVATATFASTSIGGAVASAPPTATPPPAAPPADPPSDRPSAGTTALKLLQWNVHHGGIGTDGKYDPKRIAKWIADLDPDIASLNEVDDSGQVSAIVTELNKRTKATWNIAWSGRGNVVITPLPLQDKSNCLYDPSVPANGAHASVMVNGRRINVWSTHLDVNSGSKRLAQVKTMQACANNWAEARIIAGDYNMQADTTEYTTMAATYVDAWREAKKRGKATNYSGNCDGCTRNSRIDYVFLSKASTSVTLDSARMIDSRDASGKMPSDHKPMMVTFTVK